jgi:hypothetical protein
MNKKEIIYQIGDNKIEFSQTSKGVWYCSNITINCYSVIDGVVLMEHVVRKVESLIKKINSRVDYETDIMDTKN